MDKIKLTRVSVSRLMDTLLGCPPLGSGDARALMLELARQTKETTWPAT